MLRAILLTVAAILTHPAGAQGEAPPFRLGVCCHPGYTRLMPISWDEVFSRVKDCGADLCRMDWGSDWQTNGEILAAAQTAGVELLPVLFPPAPAEDTEQAWYEASYAYGKECATRYQGKIRYFELSNEKDCACMTKWPNGGDRDGASVDDYDPAKYAPIRGMMRGLAEGLRAGNPECLRVIDTAGWLHFGFIDLLVRDEVPFDILAWHWYSEMGDIAEPKKSYSGEYAVLDKLAGYGKPVWITEGNARDGTLGHTEQEAARILADTVSSVRASGKVDAYVVYELLDEPSLLWAGGEAQYGIVRAQWAMNEGREFAGAEGKISIGELAGRKALCLGWDFARGGQYITANWQPARRVEADELRLTLHAPAGQLPLLLRFVDSTGQHLQLAPRVEMTGEWQEVRVAIRPPWTGNWAGANDGQVHGALRGVWIGVEKSATVQGTLGIAAAELWQTDELRCRFDFATDDAFSPKTAVDALKASMAK